MLMNNANNLKLKFTDTKIVNLTMFAAVSIHIVIDILYFDLNISIEVDYSAHLKMIRLVHY